MIRLRIFTFISAILLGSCAKSGTPPSHYKEIEVTNGGTISGLVIFHGPTPPANSIIVTKDIEVCGATHPNASEPGRGAGIGNVLVYLDTITSGKPFTNTPSSARLDEFHCAFNPHLQVVRSGTLLSISNSDKVEHHFHLLLNGTSVLNDEEAVGAAPHELTLSTTGLYTGTCNLHPWMRGFVMVTTHPYYALTDSNGRYTLANIPPGRYTLKMWRDNWAIDQPKNANGIISGYNWGSDYRNQREVVVEAGKVDTADFVLP